MECQKKPPDSLSQISGCGRGGSRFPSSNFKMIIFPVLILNFSFFPYSQFRVFWCSHFPNFKIHFLFSQIPNFNQWGLADWYISRYIGNFPSDSILYSEHGGSDSGKKVCILVKMCRDVGPLGPEKPRWILAYAYKHRTLNLTPLVKGRNGTGDSVAGIESAWGFCS